MKNEDGDSSSSFEAWHSPSVDMLKELKDSIQCPLQYTVMFNPVRASDNKIYERSAIQKWYSEDGTSPFTREQLKPNFEDSVVTENAKSDYINILMQILKEEDKEVLDGLFDTSEEKRIILKTFVPTFFNWPLLRTEKIG